ncbi:hypothetical protein K1W54_22405 [Micromonospora sp. CPCC 205371]|nr:hypothetical protein [Micromonospora sp. CPCC 205371]
MSEKPKKRFLVLHDCGMGGLWWWIRAESVRQIVETFAEVEVIEDPQTVARFANDSLTEVDIDADITAALLHASGKLCGLLLVPVLQHVPLRLLDVSDRQLWHPQLGQCHLG